MQKKNKEYFDISYVIQLQKGDMSAFDVIFKYYQNHIYWMGISYFSNEEKAKDLVQSVFLEIYQTIHKLKEPAKFYVWMNRIAYSRCLLMVRYDMKDSLHYTKQVDDDFSDNSISEDKSDDALTVLQKERVKEVIINEIEKLPPKHRAICYLRLFEDLSWPEISEITNVPQGTASSYLTRLRPNLKKALIKHGFTSTGCLSLVALPNIIEYYKAFIDIRKPLTNNESLAIIQDIKDSKIETTKQFKKTWQVAAYGCLGAALILPIGVSMNARGEVPFISGNKGEDATILKIDYPNQLTNTPFKLKVKPSNTNYDEILVNGKADLTIKWNGNYEIQLMRRGKEIDRKEINIKNLDRDIPIVTGQVFNDEYMTLYIDDKDSKIDFDKIQFYERGVLTNNFKVDAKKKEVYIPKQASADNLIKIPDIAKNVLEVRIIFYEINAVN